MANKAKFRVPIKKIQKTESAVLRSGNFDLNKKDVVPKKIRKVTLSAAKQEEVILENRLKARKLARSILRRWHCRLDLEEVDSIVDLSLCEAAQRYNTRAGASFMTFLFYHLRGNLIRAVTIAVTSNAVPVGELESITGQYAEKEMGHGTSAVEVASALCSREQIAPDEALLKKEMIELSQEARDHLDYLEKEVLERIYMQGEQLLDIASDLGYSRCHISRIKRKALAAMYDDIAVQVGPDTLDARPDFEEEEEEVVVRRRGERRKVTTRRPRSDKAQTVQERAVGA